MIDFEQELYKHFGQVKDFTLGMRIGKYFYELGKQSGSSEIPNDLEEASKKYATEWHENPDGSAWKPYFEVSAIKAFIAGAKWDREQMMKEAVEGEYDSYPPAVYLEMPVKGIEHGEKVRMIVLKIKD